LAGAQAAFATLTGNQSNSSNATQSTPATIVTLSDTQPDTATASATTATATTDTTSIYQQLSAYRQERRSDVAQLGQDLQAGNLSAAQTDFNALTTLGQSGPNANGQPFQNSTRAQDFQAIGQALQSGDLADAQSAFATLAATFGGQGREGMPLARRRLCRRSACRRPLQPVPVATRSSSTWGARQAQLFERFDDAGNRNQPRPGEQLFVCFSRGHHHQPGRRLQHQRFVFRQHFDGIGNSRNRNQPRPRQRFAIHFSEEITINLGSGSSGGQITIDENQAQSGSSSSAQQLTINLNQQSNYELILNLLNSTATGQTTSGSSSALNVQA